MHLRNTPSLSSDMSSKTVPCGIELPKLKQAVQVYFLKTFHLYESLFETIKQHSSYYKKPQPLRHPLIFYFGHTAVFFANKLYDKGLLKKRINPNYQQMFAVGVDEMDWDDLNDTHYNWPTVLQAKNYRDRVKDAVVEIIRSTQQKSINWKSDLWIVLMGIQHERIHLQTSAVIIRRLSIEEVKTPNWLIQCQLKRTNINQVPKNSMAKVPQFKQVWSRQRYTSNTYGWDNEYGNKIIDVKSFKASKMLVSNAQYLQFVKQNGYKKMEYWTQQGQQWLKSTKISLPVFWIVDGLQNVQKGNIADGKFFLKTITNKIQMPWDWPVEVNNLEAQAFCKWKSLKTQSKIRLPTEDQYLALRNLIPQDLNTWQYQSVGNINLEYWFSPNPVDTFKKGEFFDIVGNVWQHTVTPIYPFDNFQIHPLYEDFTTPTFDNRHNLIKGGSFISTGNEAVYFSRYAFRRHFYQFAGFRYVQSQNSTQVKSAIMDQSDEIVLNALKNHYVDKNSYVQQILDIVKKFVPKNDKKALSVGCSVGRIVLQMSKIFNTSFGIDYTARYFQMATRLLQEHKLKYKDLQINLEDILKEKEVSELMKKVVLYQMNPQNTDNKKINDISYMIVDGLSLRKNTINQALENILCLIRPSVDCTIFVIEAQNYNKVRQSIKFQGYREQMKMKMKGECAGKSKEETGEISCSVYLVQIVNKHKKI